MARLASIKRLASLLAAAAIPPRCIGCRRLAESLDHGLCWPCRRDLALPPPSIAPIPAVARAVAATAYEGPALGVVAALKSGAVPDAAATAAELCAERLDPRGEYSVVPVPAGRWRALRRGSDPALTLAAALAARLEAPLRAVLVRRDHGRQRGRSRELRLADPPRVELRGEPPARALLVDDVVTTGATLAACAAALRTGGAGRVEAAVFAATPTSAEPA